MSIPTRFLYFLILLDQYLDSDWRGITKKDFPIGRRLLHLLADRFESFGHRLAIVPTALNPAKGCHTIAVVPRPGKTALPEHLLGSPSPHWLFHPIYSA